MELDRFGIHDEDDEDDAATQYMIEQSLLESNKQKEMHRNATTREDRRSVQQIPGKIRCLPCFKELVVLIFSFSFFIFGILNMQDSLFKIILNHSVCFLFETNLFKQLSCDWYVAIFKICSLWHHIAPVKEKTDGNWVWWGFCFVLFCFFFPAAQNLQTSVRSSLLLDKVRQDEHFWFYC